MNVIAHALRRAADHLDPQPHRLTGWIAPPCVAVCADCPYEATATTVAGLTLVIAAHERRTAHHEWAISLKD